MEKDIYIILSRTGTKFAGVIRKFGHQHYNHVSLSMDESFERVYAFARPQHNAVFLGCLVKETLECFTLKRSFPVPIAVYKISVNEQQYQYIEKTIEDMLYNHDYIYNLLSVLSYPITKGFMVEKGFSCIEFVAFLLENTDYMKSKKRCCYMPDDLTKELEDNLFYKGDVRGCFPQTENEDYFARLTARAFALSLKKFFMIINRSFFHRIKK